MTVTLIGKNDYERTAVLLKMTSDFVKQYSDLAVEKLDCEEVSVQFVQASLESVPFLAKKKLVVIRSPSANKQLAEALPTFLNNVSESTEVIIVEPKPDKRTALYKYLKKETEFKEFNELDGYQLANWLTEQARQRGGKLGPTDAKLLIQRIGTNQALASNELDKLLAYEPNITKKTIELLCEASPSSTIFDMLEAAFAGYSKTTMRIYDEQRRLKVEPPQIIAMLAWQLHIIAVIASSGEGTDGEIAKRAKLNPFVVSKSRDLAKKLGLAKTKQLTGRLLELDIETKTTAVDIDAALKSYLLSISSL